MAIRLRKIFVAALLGSCFSWQGTAIAASDNCEDLAAVISHNYIKTLGRDQQQSVSKADLCSEEYKTASTDKTAQISAGYKLFTLSAAGSVSEIEAAQSKHCEGKFGSYWSDKINTSEARTASVEALAVVQSCLQLRDESLRTKIEIADNGRVFTVSMQYEPSSPSEIEVRKFGPSDLTGIECDITQPGWRKTIPLRKPSDAFQRLSAKESVYASCRRSFEEIVRNGVKYQCTRELLFDVATSGPTKTLKLPAACISEYPTDRLEVLSTDLAAAKASIISLQNNSLSCKTASSSTGNAPSGTVEALIPDKDRPDAFVTGGGCVVAGNNAGGPYPQLLSSSATAFGWSCSMGEPPGMQPFGVLTAHVIYCSLTK